MAPTPPRVVTPRRTGVRIVPGRKETRARKRVQEGRAKPIDVLADSLSLLGDELKPEEALEMKLQDPLLVFDQLNERELTELRADVLSLAQLDEGQRPLLVGPSVHIQPDWIVLSGASHIWI